MPDDVTVRPTEGEALTNVRTVLQLCAAGKIRCSEMTARPSAASVTTIAKALQYGDFYPDDAIAAFAWPLLVQGGKAIEIMTVATRGPPRCRQGTGRRR